MKRRAGILLHISSLPGNGPIGNFGLEAYRFIDFLKAAGQAYWQVLPLNQVNGGTGHSPYTPLSAFAGNTLLISPESPEDQDLFRNLSVKKKYRQGSRVNFTLAEKMSQDLLKIAFDAFCLNENQETRKAFTHFCSREAYWLDDYSLFMVLRKNFNYASWNKWPEDYRDRRQDVLKQTIKIHSHEIEKEKFAQFLFERQWMRLKEYAHKQGIKIFGDMPIYIGFDSADVWSHPSNYLLGEDKEMIKVAGVPPDYFNDDGQLWNMPIYNWEALKQSDYKWWISRMRRNLELYDLVRLDHFRGFSAYWEIDAGEKTAKKGQWIKGPGNDFLDSLKEEFPKMPFAAEDLGDIDQAVYDLRDHYHLPGMRVMQFAFGDDWPDSIHLPHLYITNCIAYTGTHDNNTLRGWFSHDISRKIRKRVKSYAATRLDRRNIHQVFIRMLYASIARTVVIPMQDLLGLGRRSRMNFPSTGSGNWVWRLSKNQIKIKHAKALREIVDTYNRSE